MSRILPGGLSASEVPRQELSDRLLPTINTFITEQSGNETSSVKILEYKRQIVNGTNHFVKVTIP